MFTFTTETRSSQSDQHLLLVLFFFFFTMVLWNHPVSRQLGLVNVLFWDKLILNSEPWFECEPQFLDVKEKCIKNDLLMSLIFHCCQMGGGGVKCTHLLWKFVFFPVALGENLPNVEILMSVRNSSNLRKFKQRLWQIIIPTITEPAQMCFCSFFKLKK